MTRIFAVFFVLLMSYGGLLAGTRADAQDSAEAMERQTVPACREAQPGERCVTRSGEMRVRPAGAAERAQVPLESLTAEQLDMLVTGRAIGGRWECACSDGEGKCTPVLEEGTLDCFAPGTGGCTGTCGLGITVDTTGAGTGQAQGPGR